MSDVSAQAFREAAAALPVSEYRAIHLLLAAAEQREQVDRIMASSTPTGGSKTRDRESTVLRMAGNIACGLVSKPDLNGSGFNGAEGVAGWIKSIVLMSVGLSRAIVAEVERTAEEEIKG